MIMSDFYTLGVDIGGSHIACQIVCLQNHERIEKSYVEVKIAENESAYALLHTWERAIRKCVKESGCHNVSGVGVAMPSPFDFVHGSALADHKFAALKGMNLREEIHWMSCILPSRIRFTNDAAAFGMGVWQLTGGKSSHLVCVTLGTGFGACFVVDGYTTTFGPGLPVGGELWDHPFRDGIAEDYVSTRWFEKRFAELTGESIVGVKGMIDFYEAGRYVKECDEIFKEFGVNFADIMTPFLLRFHADKLVIGGGMALSASYFLPQIEHFLQLRGVEVEVSAFTDTTAAIITGTSLMF